MNPDERAKELIEAMKWEGEMSDEECFKDHAVECAIVTVNTILSYPPSLMYDIVWYDFVKADLTFTYSEPMESFRMNALEYWCKVREYLEKQKTPTN